MRRGNDRERTHSRRGAGLFCRFPQAPLALLVSHGVTEITLLRSFRLSLKKPKGNPSFPFVPFRLNKKNSVLFLCVKNFALKQKKNSVYFRAFRGSKKTSCVPVEESLRIIRLCFAFSRLVVFFVSYPTLTRRVLEHNASPRLCVS